MLSCPSRTQWGKLGAMSYVALGALKPESKKQLIAALPSCYSNVFDECLFDENMNLPHCARFLPVNKAYEEDFDETDKIVEAMKFCDNRQQDLLLVGLATFGAGLMLGWMIG